MLHSSTCFEQYYAHPQEFKLNVYCIQYRHSLWVVVLVVVQYAVWARTLEYMNIWSKEICDLFGNWYKVYVFMHGQKNIMFCTWVFLVYLKDFIQQ
jgi:hypothetical protein